MPDLWMDVDANLSEVPVNLMPLIDATDFKTIEDNTVAYNQAGLELIWHFTTTAGAHSSTVVTPTSGGNYDWAHQDGGIYTIEIPASGGASINNDTEGFGWFTGVATGVLPWRGPVIGFRAAGLNNLLIDTAYSATRGLAGTALPDAAADAAGGLPISDAGGLDMDAILADTNELQGNQGDWATATGFSTHSAADVVTALGTGSTLTDCLTATGFSTHSAADVVTALGTGSTLTDCLTATGFSTHSAADVVTALGTGSTLTDCLTATGFSTHSAADVVTALGTGSTLTDCLTATGFSTHSAADVVTALGTGSTLTAVGLAASQTFSTSGSVGSVGSVTSVADKTGYKLAADGLDSITATEPTAKPTTFRGWLMWLVQRFRASSLNKDTGALLVKTEAGATVTTQTATDDGTTQEWGAPL